MAEDHIAHYQVTGKIGAGAMGEVYRALDTKLDREVAIKVLPESFATRKERLVRFEREAKLLAALNHANIATIFGIEEIEGSLAIVMELVEGETLEERLRRGPIEISDVLAIFRQIAEALEVAHENGIVHRDLKPGNIKFGADGKVKVLDFGLAKAVESGAEVADLDEEATTLHVDTTAPGMVLGTPAYMSPEQTRGEPVDKRTDVWSFGCCLFEALAGSKPFKARTVSDMMAEVLKSDPDYTLMPVEIPSDVVSLMRRCLKKEPRCRLRDIRDIAIRLEEATALAQTPTVKTPEGVPRPKAAILVIVVAVAAALLTWVFKPTVEPEVTPPLLAKNQRIRHLPIALGLDASESLPIDRGTAVRLSPDGQMLGYIRLTEGESDLRRIYVQRLDDQEIEEALLLEGTEEVSSFCFSPTGDEIAFLVPDPGNPSSQWQLKIVPVGGGGTRMVRGDLHMAADLDWEENWITFAVGSDTTGALVRLSPTKVGAEPEELTNLRDSELVHRAPQLLPGGQAVLYTAHRSVSDFGKARIMMESLLPDGAPEPLWDQGGYDARYVPSGHLLYVLNGTLFAATFDPQSPGVLTPVPVIKNVIGHRNQARAQFDISDEGTLVYLKGRVADYHWHYTEPLPRNELKWVDQDGRSDLLLEADYYGHFKLSPDGKLLAYARSDGNQWDIFIYDIANKVKKRMTLDESVDDKQPAWGPDGESIVFSSNRDGVFNIFWMPIDKPGDARRLTEKTDHFQVPLSWDSMSHRLAIFETDEETGPNLRIVNLKGDEAAGWAEDTIDDFSATEASEVGAQFSADGKWLAYASNESRRFHEVFVCPSSLDPREGKQKGQQVSSLGVPVDRPRWSSEDPPALTFSGHATDRGENKVYIVPCRIEEDVFRHGQPVEWKAGIYYRIPKMAGYDLHSSGEKILVRKLAESPDEEEAAQAVSQVVLFENFFDYLREEVPGRTGGPSK